MDNFFSSIFNFFSDSKRRISSKVFTIISVIIILFLVDYYFQYSYNLFLENKLEKVEKINSILSHKSLSNEEIDKFKNIRNAIIKDEYVLDKFKIPSFKSEQTDLNKEEIIEVKDGFWFITSSTYLYICLAFLALVVLFSLIFNPNAGTNNKALDIIYSSFALIFFLALSYFFYYIGQIIPIWRDHTWINYTFNITVQNIFFLIFIHLFNYFGELKDKNKKEETKTLKQ